MKKFWKFLTTDPTPVVSDHMDHDLPSMILSNYRNKVNKDFENKVKDGSVFDEYRVPSKE